MIKWDNKNSENVSMIDEGHKKFIDIINKATHVQKSNTKRPIAISEILLEITEYARKHFRTEETYLIDCKYCDYKSHKDEHNSFSKRIPGYWQELADNKLEVIDAILEHLKWWLNNNIQSTDKKYVECFRKNGLN
ncbi:MAG: Bacteriohemerythrin [Candidatus Scalindua arabica]|uniref:Bacteriohemerythrin n=1 Tax=Candidatus Scalindua arabica TaxID=1127984 RepID=A0A941W553_9BACT|nr:Bacteriohemerythrin [Candidatus Scalindua arabica]